MVPNNMSVLNTSEMHCLTMVKMVHLMLDILYHNKTTTTQKQQARAGDSYGLSTVRKHQDQKQGVGVL